jgi:hypothetical protein
MGERALVTVVHLSEDTVPGLVCYMLPRRPAHFAAQEFLTRHLHNTFTKFGSLAVTNPLTPCRTIKRTAARAHDGR